MFLPIKPCPFCATHDMTVDTIGNENRPFYAVSCNLCEATGPIAESYDDAVEAWNTRRSGPEMDGDAEALIFADYVAQGRAEYLNPA